MKKEMLILYILKQKASNVELENGTDLETYLSNLNMSIDVNLPVNPSSDYKNTVGNMWLEV